MILADLAQRFSIYPVSAPSDTFRLKSVHGRAETRLTKAFSQTFMHPTNEPSHIEEKNQHHFQM